MNTQSIACSLPVAYLEQMKGLLGEAGFFQYLNSMEMPARKGIRINLLKWPASSGLPGPVSLMHMLRPEGTDISQLRSVPWEESGFYYEDPLRPGQSPLHEAGLYYIQEPSAMSAAALLDPQPGETVLDLCAAPGGKSTQIAARMGGSGLIVSNEPVFSRAKILSSNIERMGVRNCVVTCAMPEQLSDRFPCFFDRILVDAPCSGEGMFRKAPESRFEWHEGSPAQCAERQMKILDCAAKMLKPGGTMVYSTCTFNRTENEGVIEAFLEAHPAFSTTAFSLPGLPDAPDGMQHLFPHEIEGEGHFIAKLVRDMSAPDRTLPLEKKKTGRGTRSRGTDDKLPEMPDVYRNLNLTGKQLYMGGRTLWVLPDGIFPEQFRNLQILRAGLALLDAGSRFPEPHHASGMALSAEEVSNVCQLTWDEMTAYQAGETILKSSGKGWVLLQYEGISLGWGKQADGMIKNHYPKGLRRRGGIYQ